MRGTALDKPELRDQPMESEVVGFFGVDCLPSSLALSPGQAQAEAAPSENSPATSAAIFFMVLLSVGLRNSLLRPQEPSWQARLQPVILRFNARPTMRRRWASGKRLKLVFTAPWVKAVRFE